MSHTARRPHTASTYRASRMGAALGAVLVALLVAGGAASCSQGGQDEGAAAVDADYAEGGAASESAGDSAGRQRAPRGVNRATVQTRAVIRTGQVAVTSTDPDRTRAEVDQLLIGLDGSIDKEQTSHDDEGRIERSTLTLRVPVAKFEAAMDALEKLGKVQHSESAAKDVTTEVIDVDERVQTLRNSLDRLQAFQRRSDDIDDLIRFEEQITQRESQLRSLESQQAFLADQTSMSTITLDLTTPERYVAPPDGLDDAGFLTGLRGGWNALTDAVVVSLTVLGAVLPFAVALALLGVPTWLLVRTLTRRRPQVGGGPAGGTGPDPSSES